MVVSQTFNIVWYNILLQVRALCMKIATAQQESKKFIAKTEAKILHIAEKILNVKYKNGASLRIQKSKL